MPPRFRRAKELIEPMYPMQAVDPVLCAVPNFSRMSLTDIMKLELTVRELTDFDLIERFVANHRASKYLQNVLTTLQRSSSPDDNEEAVAITSLIDYVLRPDNHELMRRMASCVYGNYLMQILVTRGHLAGADRYNALFDALIFSSAVRLSASSYGCRVVQSALKAMSRGYQLQFAAQIERHMTAGGTHRTDLLTNSNAAHVLQFLVACKLPLKAVSFMARALEKDLVGYSQDTHACRIAQTFVEHYGAELDVELLFEDDAHLRLSTHRYANYVVQCFVEHVPSFREQLIKDAFRRASLYSLGQDKYGSNVLETCVHHATQKQITTLVRTLRMRRGSLLRVMTWNEFGNYVVKTLVERCDAKQRVMLVETMHSYVTDLTEWNCAEYGHSADLIAKCRHIKLKTDKEQMEEVYSSKRSYKGRLARSRQSRYGRY